MKVLIVGLGNIGQRHLINLRKIFPKFEILILRRKRKSPTIRLKNNEKITYNIQEAINFDPNFAILCNPAAKHIETALKLAKKKINLFIEKPLSNNLKNVDKLHQLSKKNKILIMIGYNLRFLKILSYLKDYLKKNKIGKIKNVFLKTGQFLPEWRPQQNIKNSISLKKNLGGGVLLELSHEIDYLRWILGDEKNIQAFLNNSKTFKGDVEDNAHILIQYQNGTIGNLNLDMISKKKVRRFYLVGSRGSIFIDILRNEFKVKINNDKKWKKIKFHFNNVKSTYIDEMKYFVKCIKNKEKPIVNLKEGIKTIKIILAAKNSYKRKSIIKV